MLETGFQSGTCDNSSVYVTSNVNIWIMSTLAPLQIVSIVFKVNIKQYYYISQKLLDNIEKFKYTLFLGTNLYNVGTCN